LAEPAKGSQELTNATAVVTGAAGFLGARLTGRLAGLGARVIGIDRAEGASSAAAESIGMDLLDADALRVAFMTLLADDAASAVVIHLAGRGHVGANRDDPHGAVTANVVGMTNVLEACRAAGVRRVVFPSSALVYKRPALSQLGEDAPVASTTIYAATKLASEALLEAYAVEYGLSCTVARLGNVYGRGAAADSVASIVIRQALAGGPVIVNTFAPVRDFIYRDDVVAGLIALAGQTNETGFQVFNLSSGVPTSIGELAETACAVAGVQARPTERDVSATSIRDSLVLSIERLTASTGWMPTFSLESGLRATFAESRR
jgi:UDP-glucose 4-epimerase